MPLPIYLDNNATTPVDSRVVQAMLPVFTEHFGNPASSTHSYGWHAEELVQIAREEVATLIGAAPEEIIFTSGATEANNLAITGAIKGNRSTTTDDTTAHVVSCLTEHRSVLDPLRALEGPTCNLTLLGVEADGLLTSSTLQNALSPHTSLVSLMLANNEIGVLHDIATFCHSTHERSRALFHCDATQAVGKIPVDVHALGVDLMSFSAHKMYGPKGIGALFVKQQTLSQKKLAPLIHGGGHEQGLRSGTLNVPGIVGLGAAARIAREELQTDRKRIDSLTSRLLEYLTAHTTGLTVNGSLTARIPGNLNLAFEGIASARLIGKLATKLAISSTSACSSQQGTPSHVLKALSLDASRQNASIRIGIGRFTTEEEVTRAGELLKETVSGFRQ